MKRVILGGLLAAVSIAGGSALAADDTGAWYVSPMVQWWHLDNDRDATSHLGYQLGLGKYLSPDWAMEFDVGGGKFNTPGNSDLSLMHYSLDFLRTYLPDSTVHPYVVFGGGGYQDHLSGAPNTGTFGAEAGLGLLTDLGDQTGSTRWKLRTEVKYQHEFSDRTASNSDVGDIVFGVGVQFLFGIPMPPPPPPVAVAPPPPPQAAPPPPPAPEPCHAPAGFQVDANCHIIEQKVIVRAVDFEFNSTQLTVPAQQTLDDIDHALLNQPELQIEIQGYTDSIGSDAYNLNLSRKRAEAVKAYLVSKGVNDSVLTAKGYGKADPIASNATAEGRAQNRRVAFVVTNAPAHVKVVTEDASAASTEAAKQGEPAKVKKEPQH